MLGMMMYWFGKDYFEEQLKRIREIRTSKKRVYQKASHCEQRALIMYILGSLLSFVCIDL